ncbi:MAG: hypothetical protein HY533_03585 [Chloroflexi bacterium]|nr:hypothetical protein [Chloroflexota bacterium]
MTQEVINKLGFDPTTVEPEHKGEIGKPGLPSGFTYREVVPSHKYDETDLLTLDPQEKYLFFITHIAYPDGATYRVDLATGEIIRLTTGLHRPGGIIYYQPGNVVIVAEEGTGVGPLERELGFFRALKPDVADQPTPPPLRAMGQHRGEGIEPVGNDTIYLGDDVPEGGYLYKYVLDAPPNLTKGTLYVLKENQGWIKTAYLEAPDTGKEGTKYYGAEAIRMGPDGKLYVVLSARAETRVVAIDPNTGKLSNFVTAAQAKGFERPDQLVFAPNGTLFVTGGGNVWAALPDGPDDDTLSDGVYRFLTGMDVVQGLWFTTDGATLYLGARGEADAILAITGFKFQ